MNAFGFARRLRAVGCVAVCAALVAPGCKGSTSAPDGALDPFGGGEPPQARKASQANLKRIGLALHNYSGVNNILPFPGIGAGGQALRNATDKPLLSWRVALLPYVEEQTLYKQFHLDEPWDSEHNKQLVALMPQVFAMPGGQAAMGQTHYRIFTGPKALKSGMRIPASFPDGTSNTILVVEAAEPVIWTKPDELPYDPAKPLPKLGLGGDGFNAMFGDGSVRFISRRATEKMLRAAIDPADGMFLSPGWEDGH